MKREKVVDVGMQLMKGGKLQHVSDAQEFRDDAKQFYRLVGAQSQLAASTFSVLGLANKAHRTGSQSLLERNRDAPLAGDSHNVCWSAYKFFNDTAAPASDTDDRWTSLSEVELLRQQLAAMKAHAMRIAAVAADERRWRRGIELQQIDDGDIPLRKRLQRKFV